MVEKERIAEIMNILIEDCGRCPLERICDENNCAHVWERFLDSKVKEDGVDACRELEKILEEIKESSIIVATSKEHYIHPQDGRFVEEVVLLDCVEDIIRKHMNDGWIPVEEQLPEAGEHVLVSFKSAGFLPATAIISENGRWSMLQGAKGFNDVTEDVIAWRPLPEPCRPERSEQ